MSPQNNDEAEPRTSVVRSADEVAAASGTMTIPVPPGKPHRLRVRARNAVGWGPWSESSQIVIADPFAGRWLDVANDLADRAHPAAAVVMLHGAAELFTEQVMRELVNESLRDDIAEYLLDSFSNFNLARGGGRLLKLYKKLSDDSQITQPPGRWAQYKEHCKRRNDIAHGKTRTVSQEDFDRSREAVEWLLQHLHTTTGGRFGLWDPTQPVPEADT